MPGHASQWTRDRLVVPPWVLAGVLAGLAGLATSYATAMVLDDPRVAGRRGRRAGHQADPRRRRRACDLGPGPLGQAGPGGRHPAPPPRLLRRRRPAGPRRVVATRAGVARARRDSVSPPSSRSAGAGVVDTLPVLVGLLTWVAVHSALIDALQREPPPSGARVARAPGLPHGRRRGRGRVRGHRRRGPLRRSRQAPGRGEPPPAAHRRRHPPPGPARDLAGGLGHRALADAQRGLLPDRHHDRAADDRPRGLVAAHPRTGGPRGHADLRRPRRAADDRVVDHPQLREQRGRRRAGRQRPLERRTDRGPAGRPRCQRRGRLRPPDLARRLVLRDAAGRPSPTTATRCWRWR